MHNKNSEIKECIDMRTCSYTNWYKKFKKITIQSICIHLPEEIIKYFLDEVIVLPKECFKDDDGANEFITAAGVTNNEEDDEEVEQPDFSEFSELLTKSISQLGGCVFVKTNWHAPKDAFWITAGQTMCCKDITDIYQLLKASGICKEDLSHNNLSASDNPVYDNSSTDTDSSDTAINQCDENESEHFLILKKWHDIHPGTEFRCFVRNKKLIAISPRDWPQYHEYICSQRVNIVNDIVSTFKEHIKENFLLFDYTFDVVRDTKDKVFLLDFSPFGEKYAESLAFNWNELIGETDTIINSDEVEDDPEFRYLSSDCGIQPNKRNNYGIPSDIIDMFRASSLNTTDSDERDSTIQSPNTLDEVINNQLENFFKNQTEEK